MRAACGGAVLLIALVHAARPLTAQETSSESRLGALSERAAQLTMTYADEPQRAAPKLLNTPVLRCNDPTRDEMDGALWLWLDDERPVAGLCILVYASGKWNYEHIALADEDVEVAGRPGWSWRPKTAPRVWRQIDEAVPEATRARQSAMRALARRIEASEVRRGESFPLRLLERPIHSYDDRDAGIIDGALWAISYGTNPEVLMQIEARETDGKRTWQISFARMSAAEITVKIDGKALWQADAIKADDPTGSYYGVNELPADE